MTALGKERQVSTNHHVAWKVRFIFQSLLLLLLRIFLIPHSLIPFNLPMTNNLMHHVALIIRAMPMHRPRRTPNDISDVDLLWIATFVANPSTPCHDSYELSSLVVVPVCPGAGAEVDVAYAHSLSVEDGVDPD